MGILLTITYLLLFVYCIQKLKFFETAGISKSTLTGIFILKVIFGFGVWAVYTYYYTYRLTADVFKYFDASEVMFSALKTSPSHFFKMLLGINCTGPEFEYYYDKMNFWNRGDNSSLYNDNRLIIRLNTLLRFFSLGYFHVHTVFFSFLSLIGLTAVYKTFYPFLSDKKNELMLIVFLIPSVLFWSSGVLKEGIVFFALGLFVYNLKKLPNIKSIITCLIALLVLGVLKFYILLSAIPSLVFIAINYLIKGKKVFLSFALTLVLIVITLMIISILNSQINPFKMLSEKQHEFVSLANGKMLDANNNPIPSAGSTIEIKQLEPTFFSFISNSPEAFFNSLFRPFIWESRSMMIVFASAENIVVLMFIIICIIYHKPYKTVLWQYVLACILFAFIQLLFIGLTTPVLGAITRYKTIAVPFLLIGFLILLDKDKLKLKLPLYSKLFGK